MVTMRLFTALQFALFVIVTPVCHAEEGAEPLPASPMTELLAEALPLLRAERWEEAIGSLDRNLEADLHGEPGIKMFYWRGICAWKLEDYKKAGNSFESAIKCVGSRDETKYTAEAKRSLRASWLKWAELEFETGEFEGSARLYRKYIEKYDRK